jgi:hypothetical protein
MELYLTIVNLGNVLLFFNTFLFLKSYRLNSIAFKFFTIYLILSLIIQVIYFVLFKLSINNLYLTHYFFIGQFIIISLFFKQLLINDFQKKIVKSGIFLILISIILYYFFYPLSYYKFNVFEIIITTIPLIVYSFCFFIQRIEGKKNNFIYIISGFFLYTLCSILLFVTGNIKAEIKNIIWYSNAVLYIVYQLLIFVEWYKHFRKKPPVISNK